MMRWIVGSSMRLRLVVTGVAALIIAFGVVQLRHMPVDALPEFSRPYVEIQTEALGLSAQEVEAMITTPMEADLINGTPWADQIRSVSIPGMSSIRLIFERGIDIMKARQVVQERMVQIYALPQVGKPAAMVNPVASDSRALAIGLTSDKMSLIDLSVLARWTIAPRLMGLPGVANVSIWGERQRQLQVQIDPEKLRAEKLTLMQIVETAGNSLWASPLSYLEASTPGTGGWIETPNQRLGVRHILPIQKAADLAKVPVVGAPTKRLGDVARLIEDHQPLIGDAFIKDVPSLMLVVEKFPWANSRDVTNTVERALGPLRLGLAGTQLDPTLFRPATFIELAEKNLAKMFLIGAFLSAAVFFAFFANWRTGLITTLAAATSTFVAAVVLYVRGVEANLLIATGLMLGLSVIIDDAILDVENIGRRLRDARERGNGRRPASIIGESLMETRQPLLYATAIMALAVAPLLFLEGFSRAFLEPLALSYLLALAASLAVALTLTPALSLLFLRDSTVVNGESALARGLRGVYRVLFGWSTRAPWGAIAAAAVLAVVGVALYPYVRQESLMPDLKETDLVVRMAGAPATSHPAISRITTLASHELRGMTGVRNVSAHVGRAIMSDKASNINASEIWISIDPAADYETTVANIRQVVAGYPGLSPEVLTYHQARIREELSGTGESLVVRVFGEDSAILTKKAEEVQKMLAGIRGIVNPTVQYPTEMPTLEIEVNVEKANQFGLKPGDVRRSAASLVSGIVVGSLFEEQKVFDVVVWGSPDIRHSLNSIRDLLIDRPNGPSVRLQDVADVRIVPGVSEIHRDAVARRVDVVAGVAGRDLSGVADEIDNGLEHINFPLEYRAELLGEFAERDRAEDRVLAFAAAAGLGMLLLLQAFFRSWRLAVLVFLTLPLALVGGLIVVMLTSGGLMTLGGMVAFIALFGISVRNSIMLVNRYRQLESTGEVAGVRLVQRATEERAVPIITTALATAFMFLPFAIAGTLPGLEFARPMALVVLGGLTTTTLLSLVAVPAFYLLVGGVREPDLGLEELPAVSKEVVAV